MILYLKISVLVMGNKNNQKGLNKMVNLQSTSISVQIKNFFFSFLLLIRVLPKTLKWNIRAYPWLIIVIISELLTQCKRNMGIDELILKKHCHFLLLQAGYLKNSFP